jgi:hypothetical protein
MPGELSARSGPSPVILRVSDPSAVPGGLFAVEAVPEGRFYVEEPSGRIRHRAEPVLLLLALLVIPALVLEESSSGELQAIATGGPR